jgi:hypothetical protein
MCRCVNVENTAPGPSPGGRQPIGGDVRWNGLTVFLGAGPGRTVDSLLPSELAYSGTAAVQRDYGTNQETAPRLRPATMAPFRNVFWYVKMLRAPTESLTHMSMVLRASSGPGRQIPPRLSDQYPLSTSMTSLKSVIVLCWLQSDNAPSRFSWKQLGGFS